MRLTLDNLDGQGPVDYTQAIDRTPGLADSGPLRIERTLNAPSTAHGVLCLAGTTLAVPVRQARVTLTSDAGTTLFTGYLATEPVPVYAGAATSGPVYRFVFSAISDEWLLDRATAGAALAPVLGLTPAAALNATLGMLSQGASQPLRLASPGGAASGGQALGVFEPLPAAPFSAQAGAAAASAYSGYRAVGGVLSASTLAGTVHRLGDGDGSLSLAAFRAGQVRELANDVTVSGALEPTAYWQELFAGDGTTAVFNLTGEPAAPNAGHAVLLQDGFNQSALNPATWAATDPGSHLGLTAAGLTFSGGNGLDGQTVLAARATVELGGTLVLELRGVQLEPGSAGVLGGLYAGPVQQANCVAGFNLRQVGGNTQVAALVNGLETGTPQVLAAGHRYTLRLRLHCTEPLRVRQAYYAAVDNGSALQVNQFGGGLVAAPGQLCLELRDEGVSSNTAPTVLYDGAATSGGASLPATATLAAGNSLNLLGSIAHVALTRSGSAWATVLDAVTGTPRSLRLGSAADAAEAILTAGGGAGLLSFHPGSAPQAGERITVSYRGRRRAVARLADAASIAAEAAGGGSGTARWVGHVARPVARSSEDCEWAAAAILSFAANRAAAVAGSLVVQNPAGATAGQAADLWPGDALALTHQGPAGDVQTNVLLRRVTVEEHGAAPELLTWRLAFANDWAEGLGLHLSEALAHDALVPAQAVALQPGQTPANPARVLANLQQLAVTAVTSGSNAALTVDAGADPPPGGGFEVRRRDSDWGTGASGSSSSSAAGDLVLRSPVRGFSIPRGGFEETFFVRVYDGSSPPLYSRESAAVVTHLPL